MFRHTDHTAIMQQTWSIPMNADTVITVLVTENPKHKYNAQGQLNKAWQRFNLYTSLPQPVTIAQYKAAVAKLPIAGGKGYAALDLKWDVAHGFITLVQAGTVEQEAKAEA